MGWRLDVVYAQPTWKDREAKLLLAIAELEAQGQRPSFKQVTRMTGLDPLTAQLGIEALLDGMYITGATNGSHDGFDYLNLRLLPDGRRLVGQWPTRTTENVSPSATLDLFISHSSVDAEAAASLVDLLRAALEIPSAKIRCTSVDGYRLAAGARTPEQLRSEILGARSFVCLVSPSSLQSSFVLFELGARWGANRPLVPILIAGAKPNDLPMPIADLNAIDGRSAGQLQQLVSDIGQMLDRRPDNAHAWKRQLDRAVQSFR
jgi:hypothetical protein